MTCTVCRSPDRDAYDELLIEGRTTIRALASVSSLGKSAIGRHKLNCLDEAMVRASRASTESVIAEHAVTMTARLMGLADEAAAIRRRSLDPKTALLALREERSSLIDLQTRLGVDGNDLMAGLGEARDLTLAIVDVIAADPSVGDRLADALASRQRGEMGAQFAALASRHRAARSPQPTPRELVAR